MSCLSNYSIALLVNNSFEIIAMEVKFRFEFAYMNILQMLWWKLSSYIQYRVIKIYMIWVPSLFQCLLFSCYTTLIVFFVSSCLYDFVSFLQKLFVIRNIHFHILLSYVKFHRETLWHVLNRLLIRTRVDFISVIQILNTSNSNVCRSHFKIYST